MGYLDGLTNSWFRKLQDGRAIFYPYGMLGSGFIVSQANEVEIKRFIKRYVAFSLPAIIVSASLFKLYALFLLPVGIPLYVIKIRKMLSSAEETHERMKLSDAIRNMAISMGVSTSILIFAGSLLMTSASILSLFLAKVRWIGIFGTILFGLSLLHSILLVWYSIKFRNGKMR